MSTSVLEKNALNNAEIILINHGDAKAQRGFYDDEHFSHKIIRTTHASVQNPLFHLSWCKMKDFSTEIPGHVLSYV